jgi:hypothetical protein
VPAVPQRRRRPTCTSPERSRIACFTTTATGPSPTSLSRPG